MPVFASESACSLKIYIRPHRALLYDPPRTNARRMIKLSMRFLPTLNHLRAPQWLLAAAAILTLCAIGCASPAPPQAPALNLPEPIKDLAAQRVGDTVELRWTTPDSNHLARPLQRTHHGPDLPHPLLFCRLHPHRHPPSQTRSLHRLRPPPCNSLLRNPRHPPHLPHSNSSTLTTAPPAPPTTPSPPPAPPRPPSSNSEPPPPPKASSSPGPPPNPPPPLSSHAPHSTPTAAPSNQPHQKPRRPPRTLSRKSPHKSPSQTPSNPPSPTETKLRTPASTTDPGGTLDRTAQKNSTYRYTAQRVLTVTLDGHALELRSPISSPIQITLRDIFPPHTPTGLEAVPGGLTPYRPFHRSLMGSELRRRSRRIFCVSSRC